jgi:protein arginine N-methyltransferase 3
LPQEITADHLADDSLLIPVLADDALIFCLDELPEPAPGQAQEKGKATEGQTAGNGEGPAVDELLQKNAQLQAELEQLTKQFTNYRLAVEQTLDKRWGVDEEGESSSTAAAPAEPKEQKKEQKDESAYYFESYAHNGTRPLLRPPKQQTQN